MVLGKRRKFGGRGDRKRTRMYASDVAMRDARRRRYRWRRKWTKGRKGFAARVKSVILATAEKKYRMADLTQAFKFNGTTGVTPVIPDLFGQFPVGHNFPFAHYIFNNDNMSTAQHPIPAQGDGDGNRNGDEIYAKGIRIRMQLENDPGRHNNTWRFWLVEYDAKQGTPMVPAEFFHVSTGNRLLDSVQTDRWTAYKIGTYRTKARDVGADKKTDVFVNKWIPFRRKLTFKSDDSVTVAKGMKNYLAILGVCYDSSNTIGDTLIGNCRMNATFHYGDP